MTATRWGRILRDLGHRVAIAESWTGQRCDILIALHASKSANDVARFAEAHPRSPLIVALTGTDLYDTIHTDRAAQRSLELATRLIVLQPLGVEGLPESVRSRARVIYQSVPIPSFRVEKTTARFDVCVMGHLRPVKDPFRTALAARLLPASSRVRVLHLGAALSDDMASQARDEERSNTRYRWLGDVPRGKAMRILARSRLLSLTSLLEGGANVIGEALAMGTPVVSSRIAGSIGLLGEDYPGYFSTGDTRELANLLHRAETEAEFLADLTARCQSKRHLFDPAEERRRWAELLAELA